MTTYFLGDELECYATYTTGVTESTSLSITGQSRGSISFNAATDYVEAPLLDSVTSLPVSTNSVLWFHCRQQLSYGTWGTYSKQFINSDGVTVLRCSKTSSSYNETYSLWNGTDWTTIATAVGITSTSAHVIDIRIVIGVEGLIEFYVNAKLFTRYEGDTSAIGNIAKLKLMGNGGDIHQIILADYSTINHTIRRRTPTANGTNTEWTGDFSAVDDTPTSAIQSDAIYASESGKKSTFTAANLTATAAGHVIKAVAVAEFSKNDATGQSPQNVRQILRVNGVDYEAPVNAPIGAGWSGSLAFWENNPSTGAAWANIDAVNATEFGVISKD